MSKEAPSMVPVEQVGVVPCLDCERSPHVVLVTPRNRQGWIIPKGNTEADMTPQEAAAMEALEEAGLLGHMEEEPLGYYIYFK